MKAQLKWMDSPDVDLDAFQPDDPADVDFLLQAGIGPEGSDAADIFDLRVCTPEWLRRQIDADGAPAFAFGTSMLIVKAFDPALIRGALQHYCERCVGTTWEEIVPKLSRIAAWEYDGYR
jgi:hypothetical protein